MAPDEEPPRHPSSGDVRVRALTPDDWETWRALRLRALTEAPYAFSSTLAEWQDAPEARWRDRLSTGHCVLAVLDGQPVGMAGGIPGDEPGAVELVSMYVAAEGRGRGVADALVRAVEEWAVRTGAGRLCLGVRATNDRARGMYERYGLAVVGERPRESRHEPLELEMCKELGPLA